MSFLPDSELINLKYQLAQQIKANINRAASGKSSNTPYLDSFMDTLIDEMAELKIEISKLSLTLSSLKKAESHYSLSTSSTSISSRQEANHSLEDNKSFWTFPIKIDPEYLQNIENFHYPEENENGNHYIWMGSGNKTSIEFPIDLVAPIKLVLKNVRFITDDIRESFKLFINGEELNFESFKEDHGYNIAASWLPSPNSIKDKCTIDICVDRSVSVQELYPETNDTRKLCLALSEIEILNNTHEYVNT
ncbi:MAG: hypothetical protein AAFQ80_08260 [Cyanobacteria bacterium J06621_8]